jgi:DNA-binding transcriptional MocR family regulator
LKYPTRFRQRRFLARLEIEMAHHGGNDNGRLPVTYDHFVEYGVRRHSIKPTLRELEALGFIESKPRYVPSSEPGAFKEYFGEFEAAFRWELRMMALGLAA